MENLLGIGVLVVLGAFVIYKGFFSNKDAMIKDLQSAVKKQLK